jgi:capsule polysaccharide export protein KpsE/RkpR
MTRIKLKESLERLQAEIDELKSISGPERTELETVVRNIRRALERDEQADSTDLKEKLNSTIVRLEASHPRLTAVLNDIMVTLSNMGI